MKNKADASQIVKLLTTVALALPGIDPAMADSVGENVRSDVRYSYYTEGITDYQIDTYQAKFDIPVTENFEMSVQVTRDLMTGASFVMFLPESYYSKNPFDSATLLAISSGASTGASISDDREELDVSSSYYFPASVLLTGISYSTEQDYESFSTSGEWKKPFNKKSSELLFGVGYSTDRCLPLAQPDAPYRLSRLTPESYGHLSTLKAMIGFRQDLSQKTTMQILFGEVYSRGYLANPYEHVLIYGYAAGFRPGSVYLPPVQVPGAPAGVTADFDRRPGQKNENTAMIRFIHYVEKTNTSVHFDYRYAINNWDINSHMIETSLFQPLFTKWMITPTVRFYSQSEAWFYAPAFYVTGNSPFPAKMLPSSLASSSDYRLGKFGVFSMQLELAKHWSDNFKFSISAGINSRKECYYLGHSPDFSHPYNNNTARYISLGASINFDKPVVTQEASAQTMSEPVKEEKKEPKKEEALKGNEEEGIYNSRNLAWTH